MTGAEKIVYNFQGGSDGGHPASSLTNVGGILYGTTTNFGSNSCGCGTVFSLNPATGEEIVIHTFQGGTDGLNPSGQLIDVAGKLFGATFAGGAANGGTIFLVKP